MGKLKETIRLIEGDKEHRFFSEQLCLHHFFDLHNTDCTPEIIIDLLKYLSRDKVKLQQLHLPTQLENKFLSKHPSCQITFSKPDKKIKTLEENQTVDEKKDLATALAHAVATHPFKENLEMLFDYIEKNPLDLTDATLHLHDMNYATLCQDTFLRLMQNNTTLRSLKLPFIDRQKFPDLTEKLEHCLKQKKDCTLIYYEARASGANLVNEQQQIADGTLGELFRAQSRPR